MSTQENKVTHLDEVYSAQWQTSDSEKVSSIYPNDLKRTLDFDRRCRALESLYADLKQRIETVEKDIADFKVKEETIVTRFL